MQIELENNAMSQKVGWIASAHILQAATGQSLYKPEAFWLFRAMMAHSILGVRS